ncbi:hypothetical protein M409DRAFT_71278 [Zasmidium cellare ATCC 36951]|uniref:Pyruvate decarboxylase n=1 Tax=Zasmidium cellare ATCC 36951 TaxID=1080233 RepID=A0A6A6BY86_ZASCE|nr:uncharacterized protein M409DRAFT_71278 [Zasmidium cellare ATCC 36951]KAF2159028.1 hypothetical protein M409DRAFT_71278 [Zasmidium cellare ATCC 36951]
MATKATTIPLAQHIFSRLHQLNCHSIHGVPGDYTLRALDFLSASNIRWIGNANELCAGYAADGYARAAGMARLTTAAGPHKALTPRVGSLYTTYGVGELSAINAVAGSYAESVPVVHMVGSPSRKQWKTGACVHHSLSDGNLGVYTEMAKHITCAQADLRCDEAQEAARIYDHALEQCVRQSKPVYVNMPSDIVSAPVPAALLDRPLDLSRPTNNAAEEEQVISTILCRIQAAENPLIIADGLSYPFDFIAEVNTIVQSTNIPTMCYNAGKGVVDESLPSWEGPLTGQTELSATTDLALLFGPLLSDTNTAAWSAIPDPGICISFGLDTITVGHRVYHLHSKPLLEKLAGRLKAMGREQGRPKDQISHDPIRSPPHGSAICQDDFWARMSAWLKPYDTQLLANGTPLIGGRDLRLPTPTQVIASGIWCSIGQMLPAAQGVAAAKRDLAIPGRTILFEGDGSFQVTCQALSDIIRYRLDVTTFLLNNGGYAYERWLNGMEAEYNDVPAWQYTEVAHFFGAPTNSSDYPVISRKVSTWAELEDVLADEGIAEGRGLKMIEIAMAVDDVPSASRPGLKRAGEILRAT